MSLHFLFIYNSTVILSMYLLFIGCRTLNVNKRNYSILLQFKIYFTKIYQNYFLRILLKNVFAKYRYHRYKFKLVRNEDDKS